MSFNMNIQEKPINQPEVIYGRDEIAGIFGIKPIIVNSDIDLGF
jgi:hypothetical protein